MQEISARDFLQQYKTQITIDARSPNEHKHSRINSLNLFALDNLQREEVGTIYKHNKFNANLLGASLICKNTHRHLKFIKKNIKAYSKIYIYCARGGQRSSSIAHILSEIGFDVYKCKGGFKEIRQEVINYLDNFCDKKFALLCGMSGVGKSRILRELDNNIDLEAMAHHLGSTFGLRNAKQPSQAQFDINLYEKLHTFNNELIFCEAESKNIGVLTLSNNFYEQINKGIKILCTASDEIRVNNCVNDYKNISKDFFMLCLKRLNKYLGNANCIYYEKLFNNKDFNTLAYELLTNYYDKVYKKPSNIDYELNLDDIKKAKEFLMQISTL